MDFDLIYTSFRNAD